MFDKELFISRKKFKEFNLTCVENYIDKLEYEFINKFTDIEATEIIKKELDILDLEEICKFNVEIRNKYIKSIKKLNGISKSQISRILNINRKIIERA